MGWVTDGFSSFGVPEVNATIGSSDCELGTSGEPDDFSGAFCGGVVGDVFGEFFTARFAYVVDGDESGEEVGGEEIVQAVVIRHSSNSSFLPMRNTMKQIRRTLPK